MSTATSQAHSTPFPSRHQHPDIEPSKEWKDNLYKIVSETLQSMVDDVKRNYEECLAVAYTEETQSLVEEEYHRTMNHIRGLAKASFQAQLDRERQERMRAVERPSMQVEQEEFTTRTKTTSQVTTTTTINHPSTSNISTSSPRLINELSSSSQLSPRNQRTALAPPSQGFEAQSSDSLLLGPHLQPALRPLKSHSTSTEAHNIPTPMTRTPSSRYYGLEMSLRPPDPVPTLGLPPIHTVPKELPPELAARRNQYISQIQESHNITKKGGKGYPQSLVASDTSPKSETPSQLASISAGSECELKLPLNSREMVPSDSRDSYGAGPGRSPYRPAYNDEEDGDEDDEEGDDDDEEDGGDNENVDDEGDKESPNSGKYPDSTDSTSNDGSSLWDELEFEEEEGTRLDEAAFHEEEIEHKAEEFAENVQDAKEEEADPQTNIGDTFQFDFNLAPATSTTPYVPSSEQEGCDLTDWKHRQEMHQKVQEQFCMERDRSVSPMRALEAVVVLTKNEPPAAYPVNAREEEAEAEAEEEETMGLEEGEESRGQEEAVNEEASKEEEASETEEERLCHEQNADRLATELQEQPSAEDREEEARLKEAHHHDTERRKADDIWRQKQLEEVKRKQQEAYQRLEEQIRQQERKRQQSNSQESTSSLSPLSPACSRPSSRIPSSSPAWGTSRSSFFSARTSISSYQSILEQTDDSMLGWQRRQEEMYREQQVHFLREQERMESPG